VIDYATTEQLTALFAGRTVVRVEVMIDDLRFVFTDGPDVVLSTLGAIEVEEPISQER
jgi:hypothetical protein